MNTVKIRRAGNSNAITLPRELESLGYIEGTEVVIKSLKNGALMVMTAAQMEAYMDAIIDRVARENREALDMLEAYDRGERPKSQRGGLADSSAQNAMSGSIAAAGREQA